MISRRDYDICKFVELFSYLQICLRSVFIASLEDTAVTHKNPSKSFAINALQRLYFSSEGPDQLERSGPSHTVEKRKLLSGPNQLRRSGPKIHTESNSVWTNSIRSGPTRTKNGSLNVVSYFGHNFSIRTPIEVIQDATES